MNSPQKKLHTKSCICSEWIITAAKSEYCAEAIFVLHITVVRSASLRQLSSAKSLLTEEQKE